MAAPTFRQLKDEYAALWHSMIVKPDKLAALDRIARKLIAGKPRYQAVAAKTGVPWAAIVLIHQMECGGDWSLNIAQGDPWNRRSVHVPKGRGPFNSWGEAAIDALAIDGTDRVTAWGIERLCYELENTTLRLAREGIHTPISGATATTTATGNMSPIMSGTRAPSAARPARCRCCRA